MIANPMITIIIPVYNAEMTIVRCLDSVLKQEYTDFEVLIIDDGSTDNSGSICDSYEKKDSRVRVIHQENSGVSASRNLALKLAKGTYIQFLDSDDWITPNAMRLLSSAILANKCDMVICDFYRVSGKRVSQKGNIDEEGLLTTEEFAAYMLENPADFYYGVLWNKLYRKELIETYQLKMDPTISWCEDFMFNLEYLRHTKTLYALPIPLYYYVNTKGSLVNQGMSITQTIKMKLMVFEYYNNFYKHILTEKDYEKNQLRVYRFLIDAANDGTVLPSILSGTKKLGEERNFVSKETLIGQGPLKDCYRSKKLLDYYLEPIAQKNNLTTQEIWLLFCLFDSHHGTTRKELADFTGISPSTLSSLLQRLTHRGLIKVETKHSTRKFVVVFQETADSILLDFSTISSAYRQTVLEGFSREEADQYIQLNQKVQKNIERLF
ncbi:glycosyltransferase [Parablautia sp. Marseille-Q6255]|uniref:glycosyltransferase n=1 Tax=Parablautia sp. Marseille-Q6255 TaxID=3039593 RepID=UPI0024BCD7E6|nr:glycosyltransferase [Parablautia sp. Marseille-Q6255]